MVVPEVKLYLYDELSPEMCKTPKQGPPGLGVANSFSAFINAAAFWLARKSPDALGQMCGDILCSVKRLSSRITSPVTGLPIFEGKSGLECASAIFYTGA